MLDCVPVTTETENTSTVTSNEVTMNVYTALSKRKLIRKQLDDAMVGNVVVCAAALAASPHIKGEPREDVIARLKANYDKPRALINNLSKLNAAIAISNATTKVSVNGREYTVEELIYRKLHISDERQLYNSMLRNLNNTFTEVDKANTTKLSETAIADYVNKMLPTMVPADATSEVREAQAKILRETYIKNNTMEVIDPYNLMSKIRGILDEISAFEEEANNALNLVNIQTTITVVLDGN